MPFASKSQLRTCYGKKIAAESKGEKPKWNCTEWLSETPNPTCLPNRLGEPPSSHCRELKFEEVGEHEWHVGRKGGIYRMVSGVKIYAPKDEKIREYILKTFRPTEQESGSEESLEGSPEKSPRNSPKKSPSRKSPSKRSPKRSSKRASPTRKTSTKRAPSKKGGKYTKLMLETMPLTLLRPLAKDMGITTSRLNKGPLIDAILAAQ